MFESKRIIAIVTAGGIGKRMGAPVPKQFLKIEGETILKRSCLAFANGLADRIIVTCPSAQLDMCREELRDISGLTVIAGGAERQDSVRKALQEIKDEPEDVIVLVHDGVRPYVTRDIITGVIKSAISDGAAIAALPAKETVRHITEGTLDRSKLYSVQTPQGFRHGLLLRAYESAFNDGFYGTDDAGLCERIGVLPSIVEGSAGNVKITTPEDLRQRMRIGTGFDVHAFAENRKLILGGVELPYEEGLLGHSDADVLTHALMDALLGALALGDIGKHFPDTDLRYKGADSLKLLEHVMALVRDRGYSLGNCDLTVICQKPKLANYIDQMRINLAETMGVSVDRVSIKATTTEKLGFTGRGEGIAAEAVCVLE